MVRQQVSAPVPLPTHKENQGLEGPEKWAFVPTASSRNGIYCTSLKFLLQFSRNRKVTLPLLQEGDLVYENQCCILPEVFPES